MRNFKNMICAVFAAIFAIGLCSCQSAQLRENIVIEAGSPVPGVEAFYVNPKTSGRYVTDVEKIDTKKIGSHEIEIEAGGKKYSATLTIEDTIPPKAKPLELYIFADNEISPEDLVAEIEDETRVSCSFSSLPDYGKYGWQTVTVALTDEGGNRAEIGASLYIFDPSFFSEFIFEVGTEHGPTLSEFMGNHVRSLADIDKEIEIEAEDLLFSPNEPMFFPSIASYRIKLAVGGYSTYCVISARDTIPPTGKPSTEYQYIFAKNSMSPNELVADIEDATRVSCAFEGDVSYEPGWQDITVRLTDEGGNSAMVTSRYYVFEAVEELVAEAGTRNGVQARDFIKNYLESVEISLEPQGGINFFVPGKYPVKLKSGKYEFLSAVIVRDTTPPTADTKNLWTYIHKPVQPEAFVHNIRDVSPVTIRYKAQPDFSVAGNQAVYVIIEDAYGNAAEFAARLSVVHDTTPPVISGELDKRVAEGGTLSYRAGVSVTDDYDKNVQLIIDSSQVNLNRPGVYTVIYSATDESGNRAEARGYVTVFEINMALVNEMADDILARIIPSGMGALEKTRAIYAWVDGKMKYSATNAKMDIAHRAYACFTRGSGDCYTYMAASHVLLTRAGIDNRIVQRIPEATTSHYWNLVNAGTGWHHFDACPSPTGAVGYDQRFMFTESQARQYTETITARDHYYDYDKSAAPEVVE